MKKVSMGLTAVIATAAVAMTGCSAAPAGPGAGIVSAAASPGNCAAGQLGLAYLGVSEPGAGNDMGTIVIWNKSATACRLTGPVRVAGLSRAGRLATGTIAYRIEGQAMLTGHGSRPRRNGTVKPGETIASVPLMAEYRDDPVTGGMCTAHQVEPFTWRFTLVGQQVLLTRNANPSATWHGGLTRDNGLLTCRGQLDRPQEPITISHSVS